MTRYGSAFWDLPAEAFPFRIEFYREDSGEVVHVITVTGPGAIEVPPLAREHGGVMAARIVGGSLDGQDSAGQ